MKTPPSLVWKPVETAPEHPEESYLAVDWNGYVHITEHPRHVLMRAGWACGWHPAKGAPLQSDGLSARDGGMKIAAMHAREFKRLLTEHQMPAGTIVEGVLLANMVTE